MSSSDNPQVYALLHKRWVHWLVLLVIYAYIPMEIWAANPNGIGRPERLIGLALIGWVIAVLLVKGLEMSGFRHSTSFLAVVAGSSLLVSGGGVVAEIGTIPTVVGAAFIVAVFAVLVARIANHTLLVVLTAGFSVFLASGPLIQLPSAAEENASAIPNSGISTSSFESHPDVWAFIFDGYAANDLYKSDGPVRPRPAPPVLDQLQASGFSRAETAWSSYPTTASSLASLLTMDYPVVGGDVMGTAETARMYRAIGGANPVVETFASNGYHTTMIESGWSGSQCSEFDSCVPGALLDEAVFRVVARSMLREIALHNFGYAFSAGAQGAMNWVGENIGPMQENGRPDLVIVHIEIPHPPFLLDSACQVSFASERNGVFFNRRDVADVVRIAAYEAQAECAETFMVETAKQLADPTIALYLSDHGTDSRSQLFLSGDEWGDLEITERLEVFMAHRAPDECDISLGIVIPNIFRSLINCLSPEKLPMLPRRIFVHDASDSSEDPTVVEVPERRVDNLVTSRAEGVEP